VVVSGTSASLPDGSVFAPRDPYAQSHYVFDVIERALIEVGAQMREVVRTRAFLTDIEMWREVGRAHLERFGEIQPASTCVGGAVLLHPDLVVEFEAEAIVASSSHDH
jgi:enamine deaminase RidA (YjgF/YER057c/UK114 family)